MKYKLKDPKERPPEGEVSKERPPERQDAKARSPERKGAKARSVERQDPKKRPPEREKTAAATQSPPVETPGRPSDVTKPRISSDVTKPRTPSDVAKPRISSERPTVSAQSAPLVRRSPEKIRMPEASAGNIQLYQPDKPLARTGKALPPIPLTLDTLQLEEPSRKRKGQRRKERKSVPMQDKKPEPEPTPEPLSHMPAPLPINPYQLKKELKAGEKGLEQREETHDKTSDDLPWLPPPPGTTPAPKVETPPLLNRLGAYVKDKARIGAERAGVWLWTHIKQAALFLIQFLISLLTRIRAKIPPLPKFFTQKRRYRGRLRLTAWSQWRAFALLSLLMGLSVTASVEAVRIGSFMEMCAWAGERMGSFFLSGLLYGSVIAFFGALLGRLWPAGLLISVLGLAAALVNYFKLRIDGTPLVLSDFGLIGQTGDIAGVAGELTPPEVFWQALWFLTFCLMLLFFLNGMTRTRGFDRVFPVAVSFALTFFLFFSGATSAVGALFHVDVAERMPPMTNHRLYGLTVSLWREWRLQKISPPDGYSEEQMREVLNEIDAWPMPKITEDAEMLETAEGAETPVHPNVIVVLSESFFDVNRLEGVTYDRDPVENFHALQAESISGRFYSHYLGYGTGYIEMSMQTGIGELDLEAGTNICFMPDETYERLDSLAEQYTNLGDYTAEMLHAYDNSLYNRTVTYPLMGYSKSLYSEDIRALGLEWTGNLYGGYYMKDSYFFQAMLHEMREINDNGNRAFLYGITMENHQPFNPDKFNGVSQVKVTAPKLKRSELEILKVGVEGIVRADAALKELTDALREYPVPTIVAFYGDHRPTLSMPNGRSVYTQLGMVPAGGDTSLWTEEQVGDIYSSDYLIWANDAALLQGQAGTRKHAGVLSFGPMILELTGTPVSRWWKLACWSAKVQLVSREVYFANGDGVPFFTQAQAGLSKEEEHLLYLRSCALYDALYGQRYITSELNRAGP